MDKQTCCFNSLSKINVSNYDLIIIDEIRSILKQTEMKDMVYSTHTLFNILENTSIPLIMLDANMTQNDIDFISTHRPDAGRVVIHDTNVITDKSVFIVGEDQEEDLLSKIDTAIRNHEKVVIVYNKSIESMNALLAPYTGEFRVLHINQLTRARVSMDTDNWYDNFDIIAYSPTISEGVSINDPRFKSVNAYGLFSSTSCPAESVSQMIARFRAIETLTIHLNTSHTKSIPLFYTKADVLKHVNNNINRLKTTAHYNMKRVKSNIMVIEDEFCELFCKNMLEQSLDYHNYRETLIQKLVNNGYNIYEDLNETLSVAETEVMKEKLTQLKKEERDRMNACILAAPTLTPDQYKRIRDNGVACEEDECKVEKYNIIHTVNINTDCLTDSIVNTFRDSATRYTIRNIKQCFGFIRNNEGEVERIPTRVLIKEYASNVMHNFDQHSTFLDQKKCATHFTTTKLSWLNNRVTELGFAYVLSPEGVDFATYTSNMNRIIKYYTDPVNYRHYVSSEMLFGNFFSRAKQRDVSAKMFIHAKFKNMFGMVFGIDTQNNMVYQQITIPIRLHDDTKRAPNILGDVLLPEGVVNKYNTMFMRGVYGNHCSVCNVTLKRGGVGFRHLNSKKHIKCMQNVS